MMKKTCMPNGEGGKGCVCKWEGRNKWACRWERRRDRSLCMAVGLEGSEKGQDMVWCLAVQTVWHGQWANKWDEGKGRQLLWRLFDGFPNGRGGMVERPNRPCKWRGEMISCSCKWG